MSKEINIKLSAAEAVELCAFVHGMIDECVPSSELNLIKSIQEKIKLQVVDNCNVVEITDAIEDLEIQSLLKNTP